ncbi:MAG TPA: carbonic anhydrase [Candidatus Sulfotelmatobacter sp.]|jgi:carbonic anhydrase|nr:carbonic anhydrase [Candidatus Sulfotelmatobacter sp.]
MDQLIEGYRIFRETYFQRHREMFEELAQGQAPKAMVISCCDSRVEPGLIFNAQPGAIFTLRNVANLVPPYAPDDRHHSTSAAIEFAVRALKVRHIIVMGHARCGGVRALLGAHEGDFIGPWMRIAEPARDIAISKAGDEDQDVIQRLCEHETLKISLGNLRTFPWIRQALRAGEIELHGLYYDLEKGELQRLDEETGEFSNL